MKDNSDFLKDLRVPLKYTYGLSIKPPPTATHHSSKNLPHSLELINMRTLQFTMLATILNHTVTTHLPMPHHTKKLTAGRISDIHEIKLDW